MAKMDKIKYGSTESVQVPAPVAVLTKAPVSALAPVLPAVSTVVPAQQAKRVKKVKQVEPLITFDRWFAAQAYKSHWKAGMAAFANTAGRKTSAEWAAAFAQY